MKHVGKIGILTTDESKAVIILFDTKHEDNKTTFTFTLADYFQALSRVVLERHTSGRIQLRFDSTFEDEERNDLVLLPSHVNPHMLADFLQSMADDNVSTALVDFETV